MSVAPLGTESHGGRVSQATGTGSSVGTQSGKPKSGPLGASAVPALWWRQMPGSGEVLAYWLPVAFRRHPAIS